MVGDSPFMSTLALYHISDLTYFAVFLNLLSFRSFQALCAALFPLSAIFLISSSVFLQNSLGNCRATFPLI